MNILEGKIEVWTIASKSGKAVSIFHGERAEQNAREWLDRKAGNGVSYRLFHTESCTVELEHP